MNKANKVKVGQVWQHVKYEDLRYYVANVYDDDAMAYIFWISNNVEPYLVGNGTREIVITRLLSNEFKLLKERARVSTENEIR